LRLFFEPFLAVTLIAVIEKKKKKPGWLSLPFSVRVSYGHPPYGDKGLKNTFFTKARIACAFCTIILRFAKKVHKAHLVGLISSGDPLYFAGASLAVLMRKSIVAVVIGSGRKSYLLADGKAKTPRLMNRAKAFISGLFEDMVVNKANTLVVAGGALARRLGRGFPFATHCFSESMIFPRLDTCAGKKITWVYAGALNKEKGVDTLLKALGEVRKRDRRHEAILIGQRHSRFPLAQIIQKLGLEECVTLTGPVAWPDLFEYYRKGDMFVFLSLHEGMPKAPMEAMAQGLPVVVTATGAESYVVHGKNGLIVPVGDVRQVVCAVNSLVHDQHLRRRLIANGLITARSNTYEHTYEHVSKYLCETFPSLTERAKRDWAE